MKLKRKARKANRYTARVCRKFGTRDACLAYGALVQPHRQAGETLGSIATRLGVVKVVEESLPVDGALFGDGQDAWVVKINSTCSRERRRFTLAHEIGHLILLENLRTEASCGKDIELESACDAIAAELLMPMADTVEFVKQQGNLSPEKLRSIATSFGVSLQVAARRITRDLNLWRGAIGLWEFDSEVRQVWVVGKKYWKDVTPQFAAFRYALASPYGVRTRESFVERDLVTPVCIEMLHLGNNRLLGMVAQ